MIAASVARTCLRRLGLLTIERPELISNENDKRVGANNGTA